MTYQEKLKDPRWQKKRLEILEKHKWTCCICGDKESTLHVHHLKYNDDPWDVPDDYLIVLCDKCHKNIHKINMPVSVYDMIFKGWKLKIVLDSITILEKKTGNSFWLFIQNLCYLYNHCGKDIDKFLKDIYFEKTPDGKEAKRQLDLLNNEKTA